MNFSVLMSVYKAEKPEYLHSALESVFNQTLRPREVVLVKDGPLGGELEKVIGYWESKKGDVLKTFQLTENMGLASALNYGLQKCSFELIARMDSNDIASRNRFEREVKYLGNYGVDVVGSYIEEKDEKMDRGLGIREVPLSHDDITRYLRWKNPMNHMTVMYKKKAILDVGGYSQELRKLQDYALWAKMIKAGYRFINIPEPLVMVRTGEDFLNRRGGFEYFKYEVAVLMYMNRIGHIGFFCLICNLLIRFFTRISPLALRRLIYSGMRS